MTWIYNGKEITVDDLDNNIAFVYLITNLKTNKKYFGQKKLKFYKRRKIPGRINRMRVVKDSDWRDYWGSNKELHEDIEKFGEEHFSREILRICRTKSEANYYELRYQIVNDVLFKPDEYYNSYVGGRISRKQLGVTND